MRILLDENLPIDLARRLEPHEVQTVTGVGWEGVKNGELLRRAAENFDAFLTMDRNLEFQQPLARQPFGIVLIRASSNRMAHLEPLLPLILEALDGLNAGDVRHVAS